MTILDFIGNASNVAGFIGAISSTVVWVRLKRAEALGNEEVRVVLTLEGADESRTLPLNILRKDLSRAEILGRLGMIPMKERGKRFSLRGIATPAFMQAINEVSVGKSDTLTIPVSEEEMGQFDWEVIGK